MEDIFPSYLVKYTLWRDMLPLPVFSIIIAAVLSIFIEREYRRLHFMTIFSMSLLGIVTGQLTGQSRDPAIGAVLPAVLSVIGGVSVYIFATKEKIKQALVAISIVALALNLLVGTFWGAQLRYDFELYKAKTINDERSLPRRMLKMRDEYRLKAYEIELQQKLELVQEVLKQK